MARGMMRATIILADFAETDAGTGKVHILGAGWSITGPQPAPHAVVALIDVPPERVGESIPVMLRLTDRAGRVLEISDPAGTQRIEVPGQVETREPDGWDHSTDLRVAFTANLMLLPLRPGESYTWSVEVEGRDLATAEFHVRPVPDGNPTLPQT
jgi:hypothetical protein